MGSIVGENKYRYAVSPVVSPQGADITPPPGYLLVAYEGGVRSFSTPTNVAYGANGKFAYRSGVQGAFTFSNTSFGSDPQKNVVKAGFAEVTQQNAAEVNAQAAQAATEADPNANLKKYLLYAGIGIGVTIIAIVMIKAFKKK
jgi:hypothetical protein